MTYLETKRRIEKHLNLIHLYIQDYSRFSYKNNKLTYIIYVLIIFLSAFTTLYVASNTPLQPGTKLYFTLPLTFTICLFLFKSIIPYHQGGYALKVFYFICVIRYVFLPFFTCKEGNFATNWTSSAFAYAIIIQNIELIVSFSAISYYYTKEYKRIRNKLLLHKIPFYEDISLGGWMVIGVALLLLFIRGFGALLDSMRFLILTEGIGEDAYYGYDNWLVHTMMPFVIILTTSFFQKRNLKHESIFNAIIPSILCLLSCTLVFGNNRMMLVYFALSGISVLSVSFKRYSKGLSLIILSFFALVLFSFTMIKQYNTDVTQGLSNVDNSLTSMYLSEYVSSTEAVAKSYDMYARTGNQMSILTIFADVVDKTVIFHLPNLPMREWVKGITPSYKLAMTKNEVVPVAGQTLYYGGYAFGWILDILAFWYVMLLLVRLEIRSKLEVNLGDRYLFTWMSIICAMVMCYHLGIMYSAFSYVPFFLWISLLLNRKVVITKRRVIFNKYIK